MSKHSEESVVTLISIIVVIAGIFVFISPAEIQQPNLSVFLEGEKQQFEVPITGHAAQRGATSVIGKRTDTFNFYVYLTKVESHYELLLQYRKRGDTEWKNYDNIISVENVPEKNRNGNTIIVRTIPDQNDIKEDGKYEFRFIAGPKDLSSSKFELFGNTIFVHFISRDENIDTQLKSPVIIPLNPSPNQQFELKCTVSTFVDCIDAFVDGNKCTWKGQVTGDYRDGWDATSALFKCEGLQEGSHEAICKIRTGTPDKCLVDEQRTKFSAGETTLSLIEQTCNKRSRSDCNSCIQNEICGWDTTENKCKSGTQTGANDGKASSFLNNWEWCVPVENLIIAWSYPSLPTYDDSITILSRVFNQFNRIQVVKKIEIFVDEKSVVSCSSTSECETPFSPKLPGEYKVYAIVTDYSGKTKKTDESTIIVVSAKISISPTNPTTTQKFTLTATSIDPNSNSLKIYFSELSLPDNEVIVKECNSFPCSVELGPYSIGRHTYFVAYTTGRDQIQTGPKYLWIYSSESFSGEGCKELKKTGEPRNNLDIVFVGHGYSKSEFNRYATVVEIAKANFLNIKPFTDFSNRINFWRVDKFADLGCGQALLCDQSKVKEVAKECPFYDQIIIAKNGDFAGVSQLGIGIALFGDNTPYAATHEFGHAFGSLYDTRGQAGFREETTPPPTGLNCYCLVNKQTGLCETRVTNDPSQTDKIFIDSNKACPKWSDVNGAGCFIGCNDIGSWFRASKEDIMRSSYLKYFDPVSEKHLRNLLNDFFSRAQQ